MDPARKASIHFYRWVLREFRKLPEAPRQYYLNMARTVRRRVTPTLRCSFAPPPH